MIRKLDSKKPAARQVRRARSGERGSVIFVVLMGMLLLTSLGTWVVYAGGIAASSSGYQRSASQSLYLSELAILSGTSYLAQAGKAIDGNASIEAGQAPGGTPDACRSVPNQAPTDKCKAYGIPDINDLIVASGNASGYSLLDLTAGGSFGPYTDTQEGDFVVEFTDLTSAGTPGNDAAKENLYQRTTITSYSTLRPFSTNFCTNAGGANSAASTVGMRAYSVIGPME